jgi:hypothetical protein
LALEYQRRAEKAREEIKEAEEELPRAVAALALAHCCEAVEAMRAAEKQNLQRSMLDPPERPLYDKLRAELAL